MRPESTDEAEVIHSHPGADRPHTHAPHEQQPEATGEMETLQLREEQLRARTTPVETGRVQLSKDVVEEQRTLEVPVSHEEVTLERRPVSRQPSDTPIGEGDGTIRVAVHEEQVEVDKRSVVTEEISVGKRQVTETQPVSATVRREEARVDVQGEAHGHQEA